MAELKDNINTMIDNLRLTTERNNEQDWLKTNLARFASLLQGQRDLAAVGTAAAVGAGAAGGRAAGRRVPHADQRGRPRCALVAALRRPRARSRQGPRRYVSARVWSGSAPSTERRM